MLPHLNPTGPKLARNHFQSCARVGVRNPTQFVGKASVELPMQPPDVLFTGRLFERGLSVVDLSLDFNVGARFFLKNTFLRVL